MYTLDIYPIPWTQWMMAQLQADISKIVLIDRL